MERNKFYVVLAMLAGTALVFAAAAQFMPKHQAAFKSIAGLFIFLFGAILALAAAGCAHKKKVETQDDDEQETTKTEVAAQNIDTAIEALHKKNVTGHPRGTENGNDVSPEWNTVYMSQPDGSIRPIGEKNKPQLADKLILEINENDRHEEHEE